MNRPDRDASDLDRAERLLRALSARATGMWRPDGDDLVQSAFVAAPDLEPEVAARFAEVTLRVPLSRTEFGVVKAAVERAVAVSRVNTLSPEAGSGYWLRAFGAQRSVAVPLIDDGGDLIGVFSVALAADPLSDEQVATIVRRIGQGEAT